MMFIAFCRTCDETYESPSAHERTAWARQHVAEGHVVGYLARGDDDGPVVLVGEPDYSRFL